MDEMMLEAMLLLDCAEPVTELVGVANCCAETNDRARRKENELFPNGATRLLAYRVDLIKDNPT